MPSPTSEFIQASPSLVRLRSGWTCRSALAYLIAEAFTTTAIPCALARNGSRPASLLSMTSNSNPLAQALGRLGYAVRVGADPTTVADRRRDVRAAKLEQHIQRVVSDSPPFTEQQRQRLHVALDTGDEAEIESV